MHANACVNLKESEKAIIDSHFHPHDEELNGENYMFSSLQFQMFANVTWHEIIKDLSAFLSYSGHFCFKYMLCRLKLVCDSTTLATIEDLHE